MPVGDEEEHELVSFTFTFLCHLLAQRLMKYLMYSFGLPFKLAHLLNHDPAEVTLALRIGGPL